MRSGIRIVARRGDPLVGVAMIRFAAWLRTQFEFPIRVPVYLSGGMTVRTSTGENVSAIFFAPSEREVEPFIRIATGDFRSMAEESGIFGAMASQVHALAHEIIHYQQWLRSGRTSERGVERAAEDLVYQYVEADRGVFWIDANPRAVDELSKAAVLDVLRKSRFK